MVLTVGWLLLALMLARMGRRSCAEDGGGLDDGTGPGAQMENSPPRAMLFTDAGSWSCFDGALGLGLDLQMILLLALSTGLAPCSAVLLSVGGVVCLSMPRASTVITFFKDHFLTF